MTLVSHAQCAEDVWLFRALGGIENGFYIDVGAHHPSRHSVTKLFYDRGWRGINIEPSPEWYALLAAERPRDVNLRLAAADAVGTALLHEFAGTGLSTLIERHASRHESAGLRRVSYQVETRDLASICAQYVTGDIHFLKIDVEGAEESVLRGFDFTRFRPWILVIEATEPTTTIPSYAGWEPILLAARYAHAGSDRLNRVYVAAEHLALRDALACPVDDYVRAEQAAERDAAKAEATAARAVAQAASEEVAAIRASKTWRWALRLQSLTEPYSRLAAKWNGFRAAKPPGP